MAGLTYDGMRELARVASQLFAPQPGLPALFALTDPMRTPDPIGLARALPRGCGLVLRHFGEAGTIALARPLARIARNRGLIFLIAADPALARSVRADGVHWPEAMMQRARQWRRRQPQWIMTCSAHTGAAVQAAEAVDAVFLSPVFKTASTASGPPLGPVQAGRWARRSDRPVYALGGINPETVNDLRGQGFSGVCAVSAEDQKRKADSNFSSGALTSES